MQWNDIDRVKESLQKTHRHAHAEHMSENWFFLFSIFVSIFFSSNFSASCQVHQAEMNFRVWRAFLALFRSRVAFAYTIFWQLWLWRRYRQSYRIDSIRWLATSERKKENNQNKLEIAMSNGRKKRKSERAGEKNTQSKQLLPTNLIEYWEFAHTSVRE